MAEVWEVDPGALTDAELSAHVRALDAERCRAEAAMARAVAVWDARKAWAYDGATSGAAWLAHRCQLSRSSAATMTRTGKRLESMPVAAAALEAHEISLAKATLLASAANRSDKTREVFAQHEAALVDHARRLTVDQTAQMLQHWLLRADPDLGRGQPDGDNLHVSSTFAGAIALNGLWTSDDGEVIRAAVAAEYERLWRAENASGGLTRTPAQRRAAALAEVIRRATGAERGRPTITVTIGLDDLTGRSGSGTVDATGRAISAEAARRLACDARIIPVVLDGARVPIDVGRTARTITPAQRRALTIRDRGCVFPGCDRPPGWCDGHHIVHWPDGGLTDMANLAFLCNDHHKAMHEGGWTMARAPDGSFSFWRPDGTELQREHAVHRERDPEDHEGGSHDPSSAAQHARGFGQRGERDQGGATDRRGADRSDHAVVG
ncbi:MAG TPA: DUF222 domain-containing protein [Acidimicrobiales bacterium]|nr:DUF222 domain-containing protein [Acidimicrobiales bacterium]